MEKIWGYHYFRKPPYLSPNVSWTMLTPKQLDRLDASLPHQPGQVSAVGVKSVQPKHGVHTAHSRNAVAPLFESP